MNVLAVNSSACSLALTRNDHDGCPRAKPTSQYCKQRTIIRNAPLNRTRSSSLDTCLAIVAIILS